MSETYSLLKDSNIVSITKTPLSKHVQFTPYETSTYNCPEVNDEIIELHSENQKKKAKSVKLPNKIIGVDIIENTKEKSSSQLNLQKKNSSDSLIGKNNVIENSLSFYNSNRNTSGVISEKKSGDIYDIISDCIFENQKKYNRKLTCVNDESLVFHKNLNADKLDNNNNENNNNENNNNENDIKLKKKHYYHKYKKSINSSNLQFNQEEVKSLSNIEEITNFYSYTENCFEMMYELDKIKQINKCIPLSFPFDKIINEKKKKLAIFDLDETLVHCQVNNIEECQFQIEINLPSKKKGKIGINIRPNWKTAFNKIKDKYVIVIFTASHKNYADAVLNFLDPNSIYFPYRLYRNNCTSIKLDKKDIYIKDLSLFKNISLNDIVLIDNSVMSFYFQLNNGIPILPYYNSFKDNELICLSYYLFSIYHYDDLREANKENFKLEIFKQYVFDKNKFEEEEEENDDDSINDLIYTNNYKIDCEINDSENNNKTSNDNYSDYNKNKLNNISEGIKDSINDFRKKIFENEKNIISKGRDIN